jgi:lipoyl(octanoyl) transferase
MNRRTDLDVQWLGRRRYAEVWDLQKRLLEQRIVNEIGDTLLLVEHEPVYTWGKRTNPEHLRKGPEALRALGADTFEVERGGEVTYHGPGQLVGYPICNLANLSCGRDLHKYMRALEEVIIRVLATYDVEGFREDGLTGVWVGKRQSGIGNRDGGVDSRFPIPDSQPRKIAALGVRVRKWCTMHGFALNLTNEVAPWFRHIVACGIADRSVTSVAEAADRDIAIRVVADLVPTAWEAVMGSGGQG